MYYCSALVDYDRTVAAIFVDVGYKDKMESHCRQNIK